MKICIYCSANADIDPDFFRMTEALGRWAAENAHSIVYGGVNQGLMECVAKVAHEVVGVIPTLVEKSGRISQQVDVEMLCDNLSDRKQMMQDYADVFIALPGGIGTLDEIFSTVASATIGYHSKKVILYNMKGFWNTLVSLLDDLQGKGFMRKEWRAQIMVANSLEEIAAILNDLT